MSLQYSYYFFNEVKLNRFSGKKYDLRYTFDTYIYIAASVFIGSILVAAVYCIYTCVKLEGKFPGISLY